MSLSIDYLGGLISGFIIAWLIMICYESQENKFIEMVEKTEKGKDINMEGRNE